MVLSSSLRSLSFALSLLAATPSAFAQNNPTPTPQGDADSGYSNIPEPVGGTLHTDFQISGFNFALLQSNDNPDLSAVKRGIIVMPGKLRDCWYYFNTMHNALLQAEAQGLGGVSSAEVNIIAPCFMAEQDKVGAIQEGDLTFGLTTWASGHESESPNGADISAYEVLDELVDYYFDETEFPNLNNVVVAGHSLGGQMVQRYAAMRKDNDNESRVHYWTGNPGSLMWLKEDRPAPQSTCDGFDTYKYGLSEGFPAYSLGDANDLGRDGILERYLSRNVHYAWGLEDNGNGDVRCQAMTQGSTHLERGQNFEAALKEIGMPESQTIDYVPGVSHDCEGMMYSDAGLEQLFVNGYSA